MKVAYKILLFMAAIFPLITLAGTLEVSIGAEKLKLMYPEGYEAACKKSKEFHRIFASTVPDSNIFLGCFIEQAEYNLYPEVDPNTNNPYLMLQTLKSLSNRTLSSSEFSQVKSAFRNQQDTMFKNLVPQLKESLKKGSIAISEVLKEAISIKVNGVVPLGVYSENENNLAFVIVRVVQTESDGGTLVANKEVIASNLVFKEGKLLLLNVAVTFISEKDLEIAKKLALSWGNAI